LGLSALFDFQRPSCDCRIPAANSEGNLLSTEVKFFATTYEEFFLPRRIYITLNPKSCLRIIDYRQAFMKT
jgi:hypothetical protein